MTRSVAPSARPLIRPFGLRSPEREKGRAPSASAVARRKASCFRSRRDVKTRRQPHGGAPCLKRLSAER
jgi:hypothetical protein